MPVTCLSDQLFAYKDKILNFILIHKYKGQRKPVFWHILPTENFLKF